MQNSKTAEGLGGLRLEEGIETGQKVSKSKVQGEILVEDIFENDVIPVKLGKRINDLEEPLS